MQNIIPQITDIALPTSMPLSAILYFDSKSEIYTLLITDLLGKIMDVIEFPRKDIDYPIIEGTEIEDGKAYFVSIVFYDVFFKVQKIHSVVDIEESINKFVSGGKDHDFVKSVFRRLRRSQNANQLN